MNKKIYLSNAFSLQMLNLEDINRLKVEPVNAEGVPEYAESSIGHADTARVVSEILGREVPCNRVNVHLEEGDVLYVAQITGGRLPEGATTLPEGFRIKFIKVSVKSLYKDAYIKYIDNEINIFKNRQDFENYIASNEEVYNVFLEEVGNLENAIISSISYSELEKNLSNFYERLYFKFEKKRGWVWKLLKEFFFHLYYRMMDFVYA